VGYATTTAKSHRRTIAMRLVALAVSGCGHGTSTLPASTASKKVPTRRANQRVTTRMRTTVKRPGTALIAASASEPIVSRR
jgi:hypothetical protein